MNNSEKNFYQKHLEGAQAALDRLDPRLGTLESKKEELLSILNNIEDVRKTILKIKNEQVITQREYDQLDEFNKINGISAKISYIWEDPAKTDPNEYGYSLKDIESLNLLLYGYPYVVDADSVVEGRSKVYDGFIEIRKDGKLGIIKKNPNYDEHNSAIETWLAPDKYAGILDLNQEDYPKYGVLEINDFIPLEGSLFGWKSIDTVFLQKQLHVPSFTIKARFNMMTKFDKDNVAFAVDESGKYMIIEKFIKSPTDMEFRILTPKFVAAEGEVLTGFDNYNSFEVYIPKLGKAILRKKYQTTTQNFLDIGIFQKALFGGEKEILRDKFE